MARLSSLARKQIPTKSFALSGRRFPLTDKTHDREAIGGATRSERAGNISEAEADRIKAEARAKLAKGKKPGMVPLSMLGRRMSGRSSYAGA